MHKCEEIVGGPAENRWAPALRDQSLQARAVAVATAKVPDEIWLKHQG